MKKLLLGLLVLLIIGCSNEKKSEKPLVFVSILPQKYFVEQITGDSYEVEVMVPPGQSPATYEPTPQQMAALSEAAIYFSIGVPFEMSWMDKIAELNPELIISNTAQGVELHEMDSLEKIIAQSSEHSHDHDAKDEDQSFVHDDHDGKHDEHHHHEGGTDPHIWLSPQLVKIQAENIAIALTNIDSNREELFRANLHNFQSQLDELHEFIENQLRSLKKRELLVFHPSWGYFSREFNLQQIPIEISGKAPTSKELGRIMDLAKERGIKVIFIQKQFSKHEADMVAESIGGSVIQIDPLAENYLDNMRSVAQNMQKHLNK